MTPIIINSIIQRNTSFDRSYSLCRVASIFLKGVYGMIEKRDSRSRESDYFTIGHKRRVSVYYLSEESCTKNDTLMGFTVKLLCLCSTLLLLFLTALFYFAVVSTALFHFAVKLTALLYAYISALLFFEPSNSSLNRVIKIRKNNKITKINYLK